MSAETVVVKKRGRPRKVAAGDEDNAIVATPTSKSRKSATKALSPASADEISSSTARIGTTSASKATKLTKAKSGMRLETAAASAPDAATPLTTKTRSRKTAARVTEETISLRGKSTTLSEVAEKASPDSSAPRTRKSTKTAASTTAVPSEAATITPTPTLTPTPTPSSADMPAITPDVLKPLGTVQQHAQAAVAISKILEQAKAFTKISGELHQNLSAAVLSRAAAVSDNVSDAVSGSSSTDGPQNSQSNDLAAPSAPSSAALSSETVNAAAVPIPAKSSPPPTLITHAAAMPRVLTHPATSYPLPSSTISALSARLAHTQQRPPPTLPSRPGPVPPAAPPPRPSEVPLEKLKKDPRFRELSRRWTTLMVGLPFLIVTSYYLYQRYQEQQAYLQAAKAKKLVNQATSASASTSASGGPASSTSTPNPVERW